MLNNYCGNNIYFRNLPQCLRSLLAAHMPTSKRQFNGVIDNVGRIEEIFREENYSCHSLFRLQQTRS